MAARPRNGLSLCAGGGGLDMGLMLAEPGFHTRCFVEWDEYPRSSLIAAQRAGYFAPAPIWDDVTSFDARPFAGAFDIILAGYPCQPFSHAGQRKGEDDERHLWPDVARIIREVEPRWVFLENVAGHVSLGAETVLRELWDMGWTPAAGLFSASETGAPHERLRWFCVAHRDRQHGCADGGQSDAGTDGRNVIAGRGRDLADARSRRQYRPGAREVQQPRRAETERAGGDVGHPPRIGRGEGRAEPELRIGRDTATGAGGAMGDTDGERHAQRVSFSRVPEGALGTPSWEALDRARPVLFPPGPADADAWAYVIRSAPGLAPSLSRCDAKTAALNLAAVFDAVASGAERPVSVEMARRGFLSSLGGEAAQMVASEAALAEFCRMADGLATRSRALRLLGNGVFPLAAAYAWRTLSAAHRLRPVDLEALLRADGAYAVEPVFA